MVRAFFIFVVVALASIATRADAQTWPEYRPEGSGYAIEMPGKWKTASQDVQTAVGVVKMQMASVEISSVLYMTTYSPYPPDALRGKSVESLLDAGRNGAVSNVHGTLRKEERILIGNLPARQVVVDTEKLVFVARMFVIDNALVQAVVVGSKGVESQPDTKRFLESLKVVGAR